MVELQPLQRNDGRRGPDVTRLQLGDRLGERHHGDADIWLSGNFRGSQLPDFLGK